MFIEFHVDSVNKNQSKKVPGAVSVATEEMVFGARDTEFEGSADSFELRYVVDKNNFRLDEENDVFYNDNGAVCDAFDLDDYDNSQKEMIIGTILSQYQKSYPSYDFVMAEGVFPLGYKYNTFKTTEDLVHPEYSFSTHVLYVSNYKDYVDSIKEDDTRVDSSKGDAPKIFYK